MKKRTSFIARIFAAVALIGAVVAVVLVVSAGLKDDSSSKGHDSAHHAKQHQAQHKTTAATYTVKSGDTLTAIAHKTGVGVAEIQRLNPGVDPLTLVAGETLKLR